MASKTQDALHELQELRARTDAFGKKIDEYEAKLDAYEAGNNRLRAFVEAHKEAFDLLNEEHQNARDLAAQIAKMLGCEDHGVNSPGNLISDLECIRQMVAGKSA